MKKQIKVKIQIKIIKTKMKTNLILKVIKISHQRTNRQIIKMKFKNKKLLICIDPGHQGKGDSNLEPVAPGSSSKKRVSSGTEGIATKTRICFKLRSISCFKEYIRI